LSVRPQIDYRWASNWLWMCSPSAEQLPRRPTHGHARNMAGRAEVPVMVVAAEVHDSQTAKEALGLRQGKGLAH